MDSLRMSWQAWKAASRFLFWATIEAATNALSLKKKAAREISAFNPNSIRDCFESGYAVFVYSIYQDIWEGFWIEKDFPLHCVLPVVYWVRGWDEIPWHKVVLKEASLTDLRAVPLAYCKAHLSEMYPRLKVV